MANAQKINVLSLHLIGRGDTIFAVICCVVTEFMAPGFWTSNLIKYNTTVA